MHFIAKIEKCQSPPRTLAQELLIVNHAEYHLKVITLPLVKGIKDLVEYGPMVVSIG
jgi:hypothetical protein